MGGRAVVVCGGRRVRVLLAVENSGASGENKGGCTSDLRTALRAREAVAEVLRVAAVGDFLV